MENPHRESQLWTSHRSQAPQHSASRGNYQLWVQTSRLLRWLRAPAVPTVSLLSHLQCCHPSTLTEPSATHYPQEAESQPGRWRRWELAEREEHTAWGTSTLLGSLSCLNLKSQPITLHGPRGCPYQGCCACPRAARPCHSTEQSHPHSPSLPWAQGMCVEPLCISSPRVSQQRNAQAAPSASPSPLALPWHCSAPQTASFSPQGHRVTPAPHPACSQSLHTVQSLAATFTSL